MSAGTSSPDLSALGFGALLAARLQELRNRNMTIGVQEESEAHALAVELLARRAVRDFAEFEPYLAALLCRSADDYTLFRDHNTEVDEKTPVIDEAPPLSRLERMRARGRALVRNWRSWAVLAMLVFAAVAVALLQPLEAVTEVDEDPTPIVTTPPPVEVEQDVAEAQEAQAASPPDTTERTGHAEQTIRRILIAGDRYHGAPTLEELSGALRSILGHTPAELTLMLSRYSGATPGHALDLYGVTGRPAWGPRLALALDLTERPADAAPLSAYAIPTDRTAPLAQVVGGVVAALRVPMAEETAAPYREVLALLSRMPVVRKANAARLVII